MFYLAEEREKTVIIEDLIPHSSLYNPFDCADLPLPHATRVWGSRGIKAPLNSVIRQGSLEGTIVVPGPCRFSQFLLYTNQVGAAV